MLLLLPLVLATGGEDSLYHNRSFVTEDAAQAVAVGDLDSNGLQDLVIAESGSAGLQVVLQSAPFAFETPVALGAGVGYLDVVLVDVSGDGALDVVATPAESPGGLSLFLGDGTGGFVVGTSTPLDGLGVAIAHADLDGNGFQDLAVAQAGPDAVSVLYGVGGGVFVAGATYPLSAGSGEIAIGDVTGNGAFDMVVAGGIGGGVSFLSGLINGTFDATIEYGVPDPRGVALGDLDGDGDLDAVLASHSTQMAVLENVGGTFAPFQLFGVRSASAGVELLDVDADGDLDAALALADGRFNYSVDAWLWMRNDGSGVFTRDDAYGASAQGDSCGDLVAGDLDQDGVLDLLLVGTDRRSVSIYPGDGSGGFRGRGEAPGAFAGGAPHFEAGDFDGDGLGDLLLNTFSTTATALYLGDGDGTFGFASSLGDPVASAFVTADFDSDGNLDCAYKFRRGNTGVDKVKLQLGDGLGDFPSTFELELRVPDVVEFAVIDWDGDGAPDLLGTLPTLGGMALYFGDGAGGLLPNPLNFVFAGVVPADVAVADLDGDGDQDFVVADPPGARLRVVLNRGDGTVEASLDLPSNGGTPERVVVVDLDGDGRFEIVSGGSADAFVELFVPLDGGGYADARSISGGTTEQIATADVNGDGHVDLVTYAPLRLGVHLGDGSGGLLPVTTYDANGRQGDLALIDEDGDGASEILTTRPGEPIQAFRLRTTGD